MWPPAAGSRRIAPQQMHLQQDPAEPVLGLCLQRRGTASRRWRLLARLWGGTHPHYVRQAMLPAWLAVVVHSRTVLSDHMSACRRADGMQLPCRHGQLHSSSDCYPTSGCSQPVRCPDHGPCAGRMLAASVMHLTTVAMVFGYTAARCAYRTHEKPASSATFSQPCH